MVLMLLLPPLSHISIRSGVNAQVFCVSTYIQYLRLVGSQQGSATNLVRLGPPDRIFQQKCQNRE